MSKKGDCNRCCCALAVFLSLAIASDSAQVTLVNATTPVSSNTTMSTVTPPITPAGEVDCSSRNSSCGECIGDVKCYYCYKDNTCRLYPASAVLPTSECSLSQVRWGATCNGTYT
ncbi:proton myo-inositol cotransporter-like [Branchiostoma floridae]|uniref:Proton myo-inositol cotransporter-like n=1 Tax=Branchiostoma floridae TaxID=7739 RepID=A0A9J7LGC3_BRAFL|nr:proton myo-inositol cotransporter-like [Branchiostoma floridae]